MFRNYKLSNFNGFSMSGTQNVTIRKVSTSSSNSKTFALFVCHNTIVFQVKSLAATILMLVKSSIPEFSILPALINLEVAPEA